VGKDLSGTVLVGKYKLTAKAREGRFGEFWKAIRVADSCEVMVKLLKPELFMDGEAIRRFQRETRVMANFQHPNVLRVLDHGRNDMGDPYVVTEHVEGRVLADHISDLEIDLNGVCHIASQIAMVLGSAHELGIFHRGLTPDEILLCQVGADKERVKVLDFGLAHHTSSSGEVGLTQVGQRLGKCEYMAPEYIEEFELTALTDVYVLGIIIFEMLTGQPPFVGRALAVMTKHIEEEPWPPSDLAAEVEVPTWLDDLVLSMLAKDPAERPQDALAVARALTVQAWPI
jgi:serine/threonine protein kinase